MLHYITLLQIVGCVLVIFGHSYPFVTAIPAELLRVRSFIYAFHMPLFVFCSGYLFAYTKQAAKKGFGEFVKKRAKRLLVPYVVFSLIGIVPKYLFSAYLNTGQSLDIISIIRALFVPRENIWGHFWFLPMIFSFGLIGFCIDKLAKISNLRNRIWHVGLIFFFAFSFIELDWGVWFGINDICLYFWFFALGVIVSGINLQLLNDINKKNWIGTLLIILSIVIFIINEEYKTLPIFTLNKFIGFAMILGLLLTCIRFEKGMHVPEKSPIKQTYTIFIISWPCQLVCEIILERIMNMPIYVTFPLQFLAGLLIPMCLIKIIDLLEEKTKTHIVSFCLGK